MRTRTLLLVWAAGVATSGEAYAHSPIKGVGAFYNGVLHPYLVPAHLLVLVALGLLIGQRAPASSRYALPAFLVALVGSVALVMVVTMPSMEILLLVIAFTGGTLVAVAATAGTLLPVGLASAAGLMLGLSSGPDGIPSDEAWLALSGTVIGASLAVVLTGGASAWLSRFQTWPRIAVRVLGSWTAASAFLVLVLELARFREIA